MMSKLSIARFMLALFKEESYNFIASFLTPREFLEFLSQINTMPL